MNGSHYFDLAMKVFSFNLIALSFILAGCGSSDLSQERLKQIIRSPSQPIQAEVLSENYIIRQGDSVRIEVWGYPEFFLQDVVQEFGTITVPLVGNIIAAGLTKSQFIAQVNDRISEYLQGEVRLSVNIKSSIPQKVTVIGEVTRQDNYPLISEATLIEVISAAGGTTPDSDLRHIRIMRGGGSSKPIIVDLVWYLEISDMASIPIIRPGDIVYVPRNTNLVREASELMRDLIFIFGFFRVLN